MAEPTRRSGLGRGLDALIPTGPQEPGNPVLPPYEDPMAGRIDELVDEVRRLGERVDDLVRATADSARRRFWPRRCVHTIGRFVATARNSAGQLVGIGTGLALDVTDLAIGTTRDLLEVAVSSVRRPPEPDAPDKSASPRSPPPAPPTPIKSVTPVPGTPVPGTPVPGTPNP